MKALVVVLTGLLIVGCGKNEYDPSMDDQPPGMPANGSPGKNNNPYEEGSISDAIAKGDIEAVKKHLADGADVNVGNPLNVAIESRSTGRKEIVELLLAKGSDVNAKNNRGWTPAESLKRIAGAMMLVGATDEMKAANSEIAALLLQHGAKTKPDFKHWFPTQKKSPPSKESNATEEK